MPSSKNGQRRSTDEASSRSHRSKSDIGASASQSSKDSNKRSSRKGERRRTSSQDRESREDRETKSTSNTKEERDNDGAEAHEKGDPEDRAIGESRPSRSNGGSSRGPSQPNELSSYVPDQFPNQAPMDYSLPFRPPGADTLGAAADYYGDQGQSVSSQPGVRPETPIITGAEPHLMSALPVSNPPAETGSGSAAEFYSGAAIGAGTAAIASQAATSSIDGPSQNETAQYIGSSSYTSQQTSSRPNRPSKQPSTSSHSNVPLAAAAVGAVGAAGLTAAAWEHHQHEQHSSSHHEQSSAAGPSVGFSSSDPKPSDTQGSYNTPQAEEPRGPVQRFVNWWHNYDDVRKMEAYTEYIGVCRHCFDPRSSIWDAPRRHVPRKRGSREFRNRDRIDKTKRYSSSPGSASDSEGGGKGLWTAAGLAGLGLGLGKVLGSSNTGKVEMQNDRDVSAEAEVVSVEHGDKHRRRETLNTEYPSTTDRKQSIRKTSRSSSRSRSGSRPVGLGLTEAASGIAFAEDSRRGQQKVRRHAGSEVRMPTGYRGRTSPAGDYDTSLARVSRRSRKASHASASESEETTGFFASIFSPSSKRNRKGKSRLDSSRDGLEYLSPSENARTAKRTSNTSSSKRRKKDEVGKMGPAEALIGLGAATAALAAAQSNSKTANGRKPADVVAVKGPKDLSRRLAANAASLNEQVDSDEGAWESASGESTTSSVSSGLAFGDFEIRPSASRRRSSDTISSNSSVGQSWGWRWGKKSGKKDSRTGRSHRDARPTMNRMSGSLPAFEDFKPSPQQGVPEPMRYIDPIPISDQSPVPIVSDAKDVPLRQPKPISPPKTLPYEPRARNDAVVLQEADDAFSPGSGSRRKLSRAETMPARILPTVQNIYDESGGQVAAQSQRRVGNQSFAEGELARNAVIGAAVVGAAVGAFSRRDAKHSRSTEADDPTTRPSRPRRNDETPTNLRDDHPVGPTSIPRPFGSSKDEPTAPLDSTREFGEYRDRTETCLPDFQIESPQVVSDPDFLSYEPHGTDDRETPFPDSSHDPAGQTIPPALNYASPSDSFRPDPKVKEQVDIFDSESETSPPSYQETAYEVRHASDSQGKDPIFDDEIFDPNLFKKRGKVSGSRGDERSASRVFTEFEERYNVEPTTMAKFFAPPELSSDSKELDVVDANIDQTPADAYSDTDTPRYTRFEVGGRPVPKLNVIAPTPPASSAGSTRGDGSRPPSPLRESSEPQPEASAERPSRSSNQRVRWAEPDIDTFSAEAADTQDEGDLVQAKAGTVPTENAGVRIEGIHTPSGPTTSGQFSQDPSDEPEAVDLTRRQRFVPDNTNIPLDEARDAEANSRGPQQPNTTGSRPRQVSFVEPETPGDDGRADPGQEYYGQPFETPVKPIMGQYGTCDNASSFAPSATEPSTVSTSVGGADFGEKSSKKKSKKGKNKKSQRGVESSGALDSELREQEDHVMIDPASDRDRRTTSDVASSGSGKNVSKSKSGANWAGLASAIIGSGTAGATLAASSKAKSSEPVESRFASVSSAKEQAAAELASDMPGTFTEYGGYESAANRANVFDDTWSSDQQVNTVKEGSAAPAEEGEEVRPHEKSDDPFTEPFLISTRRKKKSKHRTMDDLQIESSAHPSIDQFDTGRSSRSKVSKMTSTASPTVSRAIHPWNQKLTSTQTTRTGPDAKVAVERAPAESESSGNDAALNEADIEAQNDAFPRDAASPTTPRTLRRVSYGPYQSHPLVESYGAVPEMIRLPDSRPGSPYDEEPLDISKHFTADPGVAETPSARSPSTTAIPIRFRRPPEPLNQPRDSSVASPGISDASSPFVPTRRTSRPNSTEFKTSNEFMPLYLVERNRKIPEPEESLPSLPSSRTSSRAPSVQGTDEDYESALESPHRSESPTPDRSPSRLPLDRDATQADEYLDSQQTTPRASTFPLDLFEMPSDLSHSDDPSQSDGQTRGEGDARSIARHRSTAGDGEHLQADLDSHDISTTRNEPESEHNGSVKDLRDRPTAKIVAASTTAGIIGAATTGAWYDSYAHGTRSSESTSVGEFPGTVDPALRDAFPESSKRSDSRHDALREGNTVIEEPSATAEASYTQDDTANFEPIQPESQRSERNVSYAGDDEHDDGEFAAMISKSKSKKSKRAKKAKNGRQLTLQATKEMYVPAVSERSLTASASDDAAETGVNNLPNDLSSSTASFQEWQKNDGLYMETRGEHVANPTEATISHETADAPSYKGPESPSAKPRSRKQGRESAEFAGADPKGPSLEANVLIHKSDIEDLPHDDPDGEATAEDRPPAKDELDSAKAPPATTDLPILAIDTGVTRTGRNSLEPIQTTDDVSIPGDSANNQYQDWDVANSTSHGDGSASGADVLHASHATERFYFNAPGGFPVDDAEAADVTEDAVALRDVQSTLSTTVEEMSSMQGPSVAPDVRAVDDVTSTRDPIRTESRVVSHQDNLVEADRNVEASVTLQDSPAIIDSDPAKNVVPARNVAGAVEDAFEIDSSRVSEQAPDDEVPSPVKYEPAFESADKRETANDQDTEDFSWTSKGKQKKGKKGKKGKSSKNDSPNENFGTPQSAVVDEVEDDLSAPRIYKETEDGTITSTPSTKRSKKKIKELETTTGSSFEILDPASDMFPERDMPVPETVVNLSQDTAPLGREPDSVDASNGANDFSAKSVQAADTEAEWKLESRQKGKKGKIGKKGPSAKESNMSKTTTETDDFLDRDDVSTVVDSGRPAEMADVGTTSTDNPALMTRDVQSENDHGRADQSIYDDSLEATQIATIPPLRDDAKEAGVPRHEQDEQVRRDLPVELHESNNPVLSGTSTLLNDLASAEAGEADELHPEMKNATQGETVNAEANEQDFNISTKKKGKNKKDKSRKESLRDAPPYAEVTPPATPEKSDQDLTADTLGELIDEDANPTAQGIPPESGIVAKPSATPKGKKDKKKKKNKTAEPEIAPEPAYAEPFPDQQHSVPRGFGDVGDVSYILSYDQDLDTGGTSSPVRKPLETEEFEEIYKHPSLGIQDVADNATLDNEETPPVVQELSFEGTHQDRALELLPEGLGSASHGIDAGSEVEQGPGAIATESVNTPEDMSVQPLDPPKDSTKLPDDQEPEEFTFVTSSKQSKKDKRKAKKNKKKATDLSWEEDGEPRGDTEGPGYDTMPGEQDETAQELPSAVKVDGAADMETKFQFDPVTTASVVDEYPESTRMDLTRAAVLGDDSETIHDVTREPMVQGSPRIPYSEDQDIDRHQESPTILHQDPENRSSQASRDIDFAATVAAGLEGTGFDPDLVLNDSPMRRVSPAGSSLEPDEDEVPLPRTRPKKRKKTRFAKSPDGSLQLTAAPDVYRTSMEEASFNDIISTGLNSAGFDEDLGQNSALVHGASQRGSGYRHSTPPPETEIGVNRTSSPDSPSSRWQAGNELNRAHTDLDESSANLERDEEMEEGLAPGPAPRHIVDREINATNDTTHAVESIFRWDDEAQPREAGTSSGLHPTSDVDADETFLHRDTRDSAVHVLDTPSTTHQVFARPTRDSGYHDASPAIGSKEEAFPNRIDPDESGLPAFDEEANIGLVQSEPSGTSRSLGVDSDDQAPSPVDSTTKNRASYLFQSPPHARAPSVVEQAVQGTQLQSQGLEHTRSHTAETKRQRAQKAESESGISDNRAAAHMDPVSTDDAMARTPWPSVDEEGQTADLERGPNSAAHARPRERSIASPTTSEVSANMRRSYVRPSSSELKAADTMRLAGGVNSPVMTASGTSAVNAAEGPTHGDAQAAASGRTPNLKPPNQHRPQQRESYQPLKGSGRDRRQESMSDAGNYEGLGDAPTFPASPTRRQMTGLESRLDQDLVESRSLEQASSLPLGSETVALSRGIDVPGQEMATILESRDSKLREKDAEISAIRVSLDTLQQEVSRLSEHNEQLRTANRDLSDGTDGRYSTLHAEHQDAHRQWQESSRELAELHERHGNLTEGMESVVRQEVAAALEDKEAEIRSLRAQLDRATDQIRTLQRQILASAPGGDYLNVRDEDYFESACQQLCQHVQQWVLRFSKFSDTRVCRQSTEIHNEQIETRLDNAVLDGSDVDLYLSDRIRRRDVFMSVVMTMIWEFVFTRYLFGMDREQRQKLKSLEKILSEVGPPRAVAQWRATTLTLLSRRKAFAEQRAQDTEAVVQEIYSTLAVLLPPPSNLTRQIQESLRNVMRLAVDLSIEMRTQRAEYIMLPPLHPEYDSSGELSRKVYFNASLMNERSGEFSSNEELEERSAVVRLVLFPLVVKKGNDQGETDDEEVVCPAQVLVSKPGKDKRVVRVMSAAMSVDNPTTSMRSLSPSTLDINSA